MSCERPWQLLKQLQEIQEVEVHRLGLGAAVEHLPAMEGLLGLLEWEVGRGHHQGKGEVQELHQEMEEVLECYFQEDQVVVVVEVVLLVLPEMVAGVELEHRLHQVAEVVVVERELLQEAVVEGEGLEHLLLQEAVVVGEGQEYQLLQEAAAAVVEREWKPTYTLQLPSCFALLVKPF